MQFKFHKLTNYLHFFVFCSSSIACLYAQENWGKFREIGSVILPPLPCSILERRPQLTFYKDFSRLHNLSSVVLLYFIVLVQY